MAETELYGGGAVVSLLDCEPDKSVVRYTDCISAYSYIKRAVISGKGRIDNGISSLLLSLLEDSGIRTYFIKKLSDTEQLCLSVKPIPVEVVVRNVIAGSMAERLGMREGIRLSDTVYDLFYRSESLRNPLINDHHAVALGLVTYEELAGIYSTVEKANNVLSGVFARAGIDLVDFKVGFGRLPDGSVILAEGITPDNARLWDSATGERLDKDRFRKDMGRVGDAYRTVYERLRNITE